MRTKTVFPPNELAHVWAHLSLEEIKDNREGRCAASFYFRGATIYSYGAHFPIAKHVMGKDSTRAILFTTRGYSNSTSRHIQKVRSASNHIETVYCYRPDNSHEQNFEAWKNEIESIAKNLANARKPEKYLNAIDAELAQAQKYADFFGIKFSKSLQKAAKITSQGEWTKYAKKKADEAKRAKAQAERYLKKAHAESLANFYAFKNDRVSSRDGFDYLRVNVEQARVETSQGIQIPIETGRRFYALAKRVIANGGCVDCTHKILDYAVKEISAEFIQVGCHKVSIAECNRIAKQLNIPTV